MGTRSSRHNKGRKPLYKEHGVLSSTPGQDSVDEFARVGFDFLHPVDFVVSDGVKTLDATAIATMSEADARATFMRLRFFQNDGQPYCPKCGCVDLYSRLAMQRWNCACCRADFSVASGTVFAARKASFKQILLQLACIVGNQDNLNAADKARTAGVDYRTIHPILGKFRERMVRLGFGDGSLRQFAIGTPRYLGAMHLSTRTWWTEPEKEALKKFVGANAAPDAAADALGRSPSSIAHYAKDLGGIRLPDAWAALAGVPRRAREIRVDLQFPYIIKKRDEHAELLEVNNLIPKTLPSHMRADIVQEIMLALYEGSISMDDLRRKRDKARWFVAKFYKDNFEDGGRAVSLTGGEDERSYDEIASGRAARDWDFEQMNERRNNFDAISHRFYAPTQITEVYETQIRREHARLHSEWNFLDVAEAEDNLNGIDPATGRHLVGFHGRYRAAQRHGVKLDATALQEIKRQIELGLALPIPAAPHHYGCVAKEVRVGGRALPVIWHLKDKFVVTVLTATLPKSPA